jgi:hypothetical protein
MTMITLSCHTSNPSYCCMVGMYPVVVSCRVSCTTTLRNISCNHHHSRQTYPGDILVTRATARRKIHPRYRDTAIPIPSRCVCNSRKVDKVGKHAREIATVIARMMRRLVVSRICNAKHRRKESGRSAGQEGPRAPAFTFCQRQEPPRLTCSWRTG